MEFDGKKSEDKEELERLKKMNAYERLRYLRELAKYYLTVGSFTSKSMNELCNKIEILTKDY